VTTDPYPPAAEPSFLVGEITAVVRRPRRTRLFGAALIVVGAAGWTVFIARQTGARATAPAAPVPARVAVPPAAPPPVITPEPPPPVPMPVAPIRTATTSDPGTHRLRTRPLRSRGGVRTVAARKRALPAPTPTFRMQRW
jgi:hypothetical protein